jgi:hypothetical protein
MLLYMPLVEKREKVWEYKRVCKCCGLYKRVSSKKAKVCLDCTKANKVKLIEYHRTVGAERQRNGELRKSYLFLKSVCDSKVS